MADPEAAQAAGPGALPFAVHISPVKRSLTVPSRFTPKRTSGSAVPLRSAPSWPVPAQRIGAPKVFQHPAWPVAGRVILNLPLALRTGMTK